MNPDEPVEGRSCGKCNLCCKLMIIPELNKSGNVWCQHCDVGRGCSIYADRPQTCQTFFCRYLTDPTLNEEWHPLRAHFLLRRENNFLVVQTDPQRPDAWKREPYRSALHNHARALYPRGARIIVKIGERAIVILPDDEVDFGIPGPDDRMVFSTQPTASGLRWTVKKVHKDA